jgi:hypothetical protein
MRCQYTDFCDGKGKGIAKCEECGTRFCEECMELMDGSCDCIEMPRIILLSDAVHAKSEGDKK